LILNRQERQGYKYINSFSLKDFGARRGQKGCSYLERNNYGRSWRLWRFKQISNQDTMNSYSLTMLFTLALLAVQTSK
jgi:hypothetical protein